MNVYFQLTEELNAEGTIALLASGQAVVFHRLAIMSKDGDWIVRETAAACERVLTVLGGHRARYRSAPPLHPRWLAGGWSCHFEFHDERSRRIRCDFVSRPPRIEPAELDTLFDESAGTGALRVVGVEHLIRLKQTQRAKDYAVIGELARRLPPDRELASTTDVDRIVGLAPLHGEGSVRPSVMAARRGGSRDEVVVALAREIDALQQTGRAHLGRYEAAAAPYLEAFVRARLGEMPLRQAHAAAIELADRLLPERLD